MTLDSKPSLVSRASIVAGLVGGGVHAGVAAFLWNYFGFENLWEMLVTKPLDAGYLVLGMFLLGFVPTMFYAGEKVVSPAVVVAVCLLLSGVGSWLAGPVRAPSAVPTPFALYILSWVGVVALAALTGRLESRRTRRSTG